MSHPEVYSPSVPADLSAELNVVDRQKIGQESQARNQLAYSGLLTTTCGGAFGLACVQHRFHDTNKPARQGDGAIAIPTANHIWLATVGQSAALVLWLRTFLASFTL